MDVAFFLHLRTKFIRFYYDRGVRPFREIQRKIEAQESPYDNPPPSLNPEDGEPAFLEEWIEADNAAQVVGHSAVSLLSNSLKLYFNALEQQRAFSLSVEDKKIAKKKGFLAAYKKALGEVLETDWGNCPVRFNVIEQVVLARNQVQHGRQLSICHVFHNRKALEKHHHPIFACEREVKVWLDAGGDPNAFPLVPTLKITEENLGMAISEVEKLADWIEKRIFDLQARR